MVVSIKNMSKLKAFTPLFYTDLIANLNPHLTVAYNNYTDNNVSSNVKKKWGKSGEGNKNVEHPCKSLKKKTRID